MEHRQTIGQMGMWFRNARFSDGRLSMPRASGCDRRRGKQPAAPRSARLLNDGVQQHVMFLAEGLDGGRDMLASGAVHRGDAR
jgi:hypothetical protein